MYNIVMPLTLNFICGVNVFWLLKVTLDTLCAVGYKNRNNRVYWMSDVCLKYDKRSELQCVNASPFPKLRPIHFSHLFNMLFDIGTEMTILIWITQLYIDLGTVFTFFFFLQNLNMMYCIYNVIHNITIGGKLSFTAYTI